MPSSGAGASIDGRMGAWDGAIGDITNLVPDGEGVVALDDGEGKVQDDDQSDTETAKVLQQV